MADDRQAFLERRRKAIGASDVGTIFGLNQYQTPYELWLDKTGRIAPDDDTNATKFGRFLESGILDYAESQLGEIERNVVVPHTSAPLVATLDGCLQVIPVEAKTAGLANAFADLSDWGEPESDEVPAVYLCQVQAQMLCTGADLAYLYALIAGRGIVRYQIPKSAEVGSVIVDRCSEWWEKHVIRDTPPPLDPLPAPEVFSRVVRQPSKTVELSSDVTAWLHAQSLAKDEIKRQKAQVDQLQSRILASLGDAEAGNLPDGRRVTYFEQSRKGYMVEPKSFRVMRVKKGRK